MSQARSQSRNRAGGGSLYRMINSSSTRLATPAVVGSLAAPLTRLREVVFAESAPSSFGHERDESVQVDSDDKTSQEQPNRSSNNANVDSGEKNETDAGKDPVEEGGTTYVRVNYGGGSYGWMRAQDVLPYHRQMLASSNPMRTPKHRDSALERQKSAHRQEQSTNQRQQSAREPQEPVPKHSSSDHGRQDPVLDSQEPNPKLEESASNERESPPRHPAAVPRQHVLVHEPQESAPSLQEAAQEEQENVDESQGSNYREEDSVPKHQQSAQQPKESIHQRQEPSDQPNGFVHDHQGSSYQLEVAVHHSETSVHQLEKPVAQPEEYVDEDLEPDHEPAAFIFLPHLQNDMYAGAFLHTPPAAYADQYPSEVQEAIRMQEEEELRQKDFQEEDGFEGYIQGIEGVEQQQFQSGSEVEQEYFQEEEADEHYLHTEANVSSEHLEEEEYATQESVQEDIHSDEDYIPDEGKYSQPRPLARPASPGTFSLGSEIETSDYDTDLEITHRAHLDAAMVPRQQAGRNLAHRQMLSKQQQRAMLKIAIRNNWSRDTLLLGDDAKRMARAGRFGRQKRQTRRSGSRNQDESEVDSDPYDSYYAAGPSGGRRRQVLDHTSDVEVSDERGIEAAWTEGQYHYAHVSGPGAGSADGLNQHQEEYTSDVEARVHHIQSDYQRGEVSNLAANPIYDENGHEYDDKPAGPVVLDPHGLIREEARVPEMHCGVDNVVDYSKYRDVTRTTRAVVTFELPTNGPVRTGTSVARAVEKPRGFRFWPFNLMKKKVPDTRRSGDGSFVRRGTRLAIEAPPARPTQDTTGYKMALVAGAHINAAGGRPDFQAAQQKPGQHLDGAELDRRLAEYKHRVELGLEPPPTLYLTPTNPEAVSNVNPVTTVGFPANGTIKPKQGLFTITKSTLQGLGCFGGHDMQKPRQVRVPNKLVKKRPVRKQL